MTSFGFNVIFAAALLFLVTVSADSTMKSNNGKPPKHCFDYWARFQNDNFLSFPCNSSTPFACVYEGYFVENLCFTTKDKASEGCAKKEKEGKKNTTVYDLQGCFASECEACNEEDCSILTAAGFCNMEEHYTCIYPSPYQNEAYVTPCQSNKSHWIARSRCGKCCDTRSCKRPPLPCSAMSAVMCKHKNDWDDNMCPWDKPYVCDNSGAEDSSCFSAPADAPGSCFLAMFNSTCLDERSCGTTKCPLCSKEVCRNTSYLCPMEEQYQCTGDYGRAGQGDCSSATWTKNVKCSACCDTSECDREPLTCGSPCSAEQCQNAYHFCDYNNGSNLYLVFASKVGNPYGDNSQNFRCFTKWTDPPKYKSKDAIGCCTITKACTGKDCWANKFSCSNTNCPQYCTQECQPCNNECGGNSCSSSCSACPHCCAWAGCPGCGDPCNGMCFMDGNCFGECTCGTSNCPGSEFWALLYTNFTMAHNIKVGAGQQLNGLKDLFQDPLHISKELERQIFQVPVKTSSVQKELERLHERFFGKKKQQ